MGPADGPRLPAPRVVPLPVLPQLIRACSDSSSAVRTSVCCVWEAYAVSEVLKNTPFVASACRELVKLMKDPVLAVRQKASWALGNVFVSFESPDRARGLCDLLNLSDLRSVASALFVGLDDHDKVAVACVRGVGRCVAGLFEACGELPPGCSLDGLSYTGAALTEPVRGASTASSTSGPLSSPGRTLFASDLELGSAIIKAIARSTLSGGVKLRWNACHSLAVVMPWSCSESLVTNGAGSAWIPVAFRALMGALCSENFKIRIAACSAITKVPLRVGYGAYYCDVAMGLVSAIQAMVHDVSEYSELRYEDALRSGLHAALAHVIRLGSETDFAPGSPLRAFVIDNADVVREAIVSSPPPPAAAGAMFEDAGTAVVERLLLFLV